MWRPLPCSFCLVPTTERCPPQMIFVSFTLDTLYYGRVWKFQPTPSMESHGSLDGLSLFCRSIYTDDGEFLRWFQIVSENNLRGYIYILLFPRNAYNMAKIRGTVRGTEGGTVRGWRSKKLVLDRSKTRTSGAWDSSLARSNACHNLEMIRG
jgi:hypothetical protein